MPLSDPNEQAGVSLRPEGASVIDPNPGVEVDPLQVPTSEGVASTGPAQPPLEEGRPKRSDVILANIEERKQRESRLGFVLETTKDEDKERKLKAARIAKERGLPAFFVENNLEEFEGLKRKEGYKKVAERSPAFSKWLENPNNAALVNEEEITMLSEAEQSLSSPSYISELKDAGVGGFDQLSMSTALMGVMYNKLSADDAAEFIAENQKKVIAHQEGKAQYLKDFDQVIDEEAGDISESFLQVLNSFEDARQGKRLKAIAEFGAGSARTIGQTLDLISETIIKRPRATSLKTAESLVTSSPALLLGGSTGAAASAAGPLGTIVGTGTGLFTGSLFVETGSYALGEMQKRGVDLTDPEAIKEAFKDKAFMADIKAKAKRKGIATSAVDTMFFAMGGRFTKGAMARKSSKAAFAKAGAKDLAVESAGEAIGEAAGQLAAEGDIRKVDVGGSILEGILSAPHSGGELVLKTSAYRTSYAEDTSKAASEVFDDTTKSIETINNKSRLDEVMDKVSQIKDLAQVPGAIKEVMKISGQEQNMPSHVFFQKDEFDGFWSTRSLSEQQQEVVVDSEGNSYVEIEFGEYVEKFASTEDVKDLNELARIEPSGPNMKEATEQLQDLPSVMEALSKEAQGQIKDKKVNQTEAELRDIRSGVKQQLKDAGYSDKDASKQALLLGESYRVRSKLYGVNPKKLFDKRPVFVKLVDKIKGNPKALGSTDVSNENQIIVNIANSKNPSTFLHESGHLFLHNAIDDFKFLSNLNKPTPEQSKALEGMDGVLEFLEIKDFSEVKRVHHEKFARGFEQFLREGKTSNSKLKEAFKTFMTWLLTVYKSAESLEVELSPEIREFYDSLVSIDTEINEQSEAMGDYLFEGLRKQGLSKDQASRIEEAIKDSKAEALKQMGAQLYKAEEKKRTKVFKDKRKRIKDQADAYINNENLYVMVDAIRNGEFLAKLDAKEVKKIAGENFKSIPKSVMQREGGVNPVDLVDVFGYDSTKALLDDLAENGSNKVRAKRKQALVKESMEKFYKENGDILTEDQIEAEVSRQLANDKRMDLIKLEAKIVAEQAPASMRKIIEKAVSSMPSNRLVNYQARKTVGGIHVKNLRPKMFLNLSKKSSQLAAKALRDGDFVMVVEHKKRQQLNMALYSESLKAKEELGKIKALKKRLFRPDDKMAKTRDMDLVNAARALLAKFKMAPGDNKDVNTYLENTKAHDNKTYEYVRGIIDSIAPDKGPNSLTFNDYTEVKTAAQSLYDLAKERKLVFDQDGRVALDTAVGELTENFDFLSSNKEHKSKLERTAADVNSYKYKLLSFETATRRMNSLVNVLDMGAVMGPVRKYIYQPIIKAVDTYRVNFYEKLEGYKALVEKHEMKKLSKDPIYAKELTYIDAKTKKEKSYTFANKQELLGAILHIGNPSNYQKLLRGYGWGEMNGGVLDDSNWKAFLTRAFEEGTVTKNDMDFVQGVWDMFEKEKPALQKAHKQMMGFFFGEIKAQEIVTPFGTYRGGYVPAKADPRKTLSVKKIDNASLIEDENYGNAFPPAEMGSTKGRNEAYAEPLLLDISYIPRHLDWTQRFIHIFPKSRAAGNILKDKGFQASLEGVNEHLLENVILGWLNRSSTQRASKPVIDPGLNAVNNMAGIMRSRVSGALLGFNVRNALEESFSLSIVAKRIGIKNLSKGMYNYLANHKESMEIIAKNDFLKTRNKQDLFEVSRGLDEILLDSKGRISKEGFFQKHKFFFQKVIRNILDNVTFLGAYEEGLGIKELDTHDKVLDHANRQIRDTLGSFNVEDISSIEAGNNMFQLFTQFAGFFLHLKSFNQSEIQVISQESGIKSGKGMSKIALTLLMGASLPLWLSEVLRDIMAGDVDKDDDDEYLDDLGRSFVNSHVEGVKMSAPFIGNVAATGVNKFNDNIYDDKLNLSPTFSVLERSLGAPYNVYRTLKDDKSKKNAVKDSLLLLNILTGKPTGALARPVGYLIEVSEGTATPTGPIDFVRGVASGKRGDN